MGETVRAWVVVMAAGFGSYYLLAPWLAMQFESRALLKRYLLVWALVLSAAFLLGDYTFFYLFTAVVLIWAANVLGRDCIGLYALMLFSLPMLGVSLPGMGIAKTLFELTVPRVVSLSLLVLVAFRHRGLLHAARSYPADNAIVMYFFFSIMLYMMRAESATDILRSIFLVFIDSVIPYFVISRLGADRRTFNVTLAGLIFGGVAMALVALVEVGKDWLVYKSLYRGLHLPDIGTAGYELVRGGVLRVSGIFASPIVNGLHMFIVIGLLTFAGATGLFDKFKSRQFLSTAIVASALLATLSRGPLIGCVVFFMMFWWWTGGANKIFRQLLYILPIALIVLVTGNSSRIESLAGLGESKDFGNVTYRAQLFEASLPVIERNPLFGSDDFLSAPELQPLRQGQGIIDIVNSYIQVTLQYGLVGLVLFVWMFLAAFKYGVAAKNGSVPSTDLYGWLTLKAMIVGFMVVIATVSRIDYVPYLQIVLLALAISWRRQLESREQHYV